MTTKKETVTQAKKPTKKVAPKFSLSELKGAINSNLPRLSVDMVKDLTAKWAKKNGYTSGKRKMLSAKAKKVKEVLQNQTFAEYKDAVIKVCEIILDEPLNLNKKGVKLQSGVMYVPLADHNGHEYPLNKPVLCRDGDDCFEVDGDVKGSFTTDTNDFRPATNKEIDKFFSTIDLNKSADVKDRLKTLLMQEAGVA